MNYVARKRRGTTHIGSRLARRIDIDKPLPLVLPAAAIKIA